MNWVPMITLLNLYLVLPRIMDMSKTREESKCEDLCSWIHFSYFELSFSFSFTHSFGTLLSQSVYQVGLKARHDW